jgi:hypothetical protein
MSKDPKVGSTFILRRRSRPGFDCPGARASRSFLLSWLYVEIPSGGSGKLLTALLVAQYYSTRRKSRSQSAVNEVGECRADCLQTGRNDDLGRPADGCERGRSPCVSRIEIAKLALQHGNCQKGMRQRSILDIHQAWLVRARLRFTYLRLGTKGR